MSRQTEQLLLELQQVTLCLYLSDLRCTAFDDRAKKLIAKYQMSAIALKHGMKRCPMYSMRTVTIHP